MLLEEFKDSVRKEVKIHLDEQKVASLRQAAKMADDYELTHKQSFVRNPGYAYNRGYQDNKVYNPSEGKGCNPGRENRDQKGSDVSAKAAKKVEQKEGLEQSSLGCQHVFIVRRKDMLCQIVGSLRSKVKRKGQQSTWLVVRHHCRWKA